MSLIGHVDRGRQTLRMDSASRDVRQVSAIDCRCHRTDPTMITAPRITSPINGAGRKPSGDRLSPISISTPNMLKKKPTPNSNRCAICLPSRFTNVQGSPGEPPERRGALQSFRTPDNRHPIIRPGLSITRRTTAQAMHRIFPGVNASCPNFYVRVFTAIASRTEHCSVAVALRVLPAVSSRSCRSEKYSIACSALGSLTGYSIRYDNDDCERRLRCVLPGHGAATTARLRRPARSTPCRRRSWCGVGVRMEQLGSGRSHGVSGRVLVPSRAVEISAATPGSASCVATEREQPGRTDVGLGNAAATCSTA